MTNEQLAILCKTDESYLPELWEAVRKLICKWAMRYLPEDGATARYDVDDLIQSAYFALLRAVKDYPEDSPLKFSTYLWNHCRNAFGAVVGIRAKKRTPPTMSLDAPLTGEDDFTLLDTLEDENATEDFTEVERRVFNEQLSEAIEKAMATIPDRERAVICKRFYEDKTFKAICAELGCTCGAARQAEYNGLRSLRRHRTLRGFDYRSEGLKGTGLSRFRETGVSSVDAAVLRLAGLDRVEV